MAGKRPDWRASIRLVKAVRSLAAAGAFINEGLARIEHNEFNQNLGFGLALYEFLESRSRWPIHFNTANRNLVVGITAAQLGFTGIGNVAKHNGSTQCANFPCNVK